MMTLYPVRVRSVPTSSSVALDVRRENCRELSLDVVASNLGTSPAEYS
jgi:hypothetical protein